MIQNIMVCSVLLYLTPGFILFRRLTTSLLWFTAACNSLRSPTPASFKALNFEDSQTQQGHNQLMNFFPLHPVFTLSLCLSQERWHYKTKASFLTESQDVGDGRQAETHAWQSWAKCWIWSVSTQTPDVRHNLQYAWGPLKPVIIPPRCLRSADVWMLFSISHHLHFGSSKNQVGIKKMIKAQGMAGFRLNFCKCTVGEASPASRSLWCLWKKRKGAGQATHTHMHTHMHINMYKQAFSSTV